MAKIAGGKITGSHTTAIDAAVPIIKAAQNMPEVTKISLGIIKQGAGSGRSSLSLKTKDLPAGLLLTVKGSATVQEIHIFTKAEHRHNVAKALSAAFKKS